MSAACSLVVTFDDVACPSDVMCQQHSDDCDREHVHFSQYVVVIFRGQLRRYHSAVLMVLYQEDMHVGSM